VEEEPSTSSKRTINLANIKVQFNGTNYNVWQRSILGMLKLEGLRQHVLEPVDASRSQSSTYQSDREAALIFLQALILDNILINYEDKEDPHELWIALQRRYAELNRAQVAQIKLEMFKTHRSNYDKLDDYLLAMQKHHTKLTQGGVKWTEEAQIDDIINGLGTQYNHWVNNLGNDLLKNKDRFLAALSQHNDQKC
jgi:hypothetical protein